MDAVLMLKTVAIGIVEGLTEFVPVSSTGHMIIVDDLILHFKHAIGSDVAACFEVVIQLGAILAVVVLYRHRFLHLFVPEGDKAGGFRGRRGIGLLAITTIPACIVGAPLDGIVEQYLFNAGTVALGLSVGAIGILAAERLKPGPVAGTLDDLTWRQALLVGLFQCISIWPGISRSASTIVGGMLGRVDRKAAAEYSFLAAVPVMFAASGYKLYSTWDALSIDHLGVFVVGFIVSFVAAMLAVKGFIHLLGRWTLVPFAWYRLGIAPVVGVAYFLCG